MNENNNTNNGDISLNSSTARDIMPINNITGINIEKLILNLNDNDFNMKRTRTERPYLQDKFNNDDTVQCVGFCIRKYDEYGKYTLMNVHDLKGNYVADHIQVNFKNFNIDPLYMMIEVRGEVEEYDHRIKHCKEYSILVNSYQCDDGYFKRIKKVDYANNRSDGFIEKFTQLKSNQLIKLSKLLFDEINQSVPDSWKNKIQNYIADLYFFGNYRTDVSICGVPINKITDVMYIDLILIYAATIYYLTEFEYYTTYNVYHIITRIVNTQQMIKYYKHPDSPGNNFIHFIESRGFIKTEINEAMINSIWEVVRIRKKNFGGSDVCFDPIDHLTEACKVIVSALRYLSIDI